MNRPIAERLANITGARDREVAKDALLRVDLSWPPDGYPDDAPTVPIQDVCAHLAGQTDWPTPGAVIYTFPDGSAFVHTVRDGWGPRAAGCEGWCAGEFGCTCAHAAYSELDEVDNA